MGLHPTSIRYWGNKTRSVRRSCGVGVDSAEESSPSSPPSSHSVSVTPTTSSICIPGCLQDGDDRLYPNNALQNPDP